MTMTDPIPLANDVERMSDRLDTLEAEGRAEEPAYEDLWQARDEAIQAIADRHAPEAARYGTVRLLIAARLRHLSFPFADRAWFDEG